MAHASLPPSFWHHALSMATYLLNILPSKLLDHQSPLKILYKRDPLYSHLRVFGCLCYPLFPSTMIYKLQPCSTPCVFLGYPPNHRGYKCYNISSRKFFVSYHVLFDETQFPFAKIHSPTPSTYSFLDDSPSPYVSHHLEQLGNDQPTPTSPGPISPSSRPISPSSPLTPPCSASPPRILLLGLLPYSRTPCPHKWTSLYPLLRIHKQLPVLHCLLLKTTHALAP